jgi:MFS-type transporter involved in bile tolerance (Atg22 family)
MQTMLRLTSSNHIQLSEMADNKANILISVNAIIISVILSILLRKLQTDPYLTYPTIIFLLSSVATIVVSILATRPKLSSGTFADEDIVNKKTNLLFFGNFHKMPQVNYENAMRTMMQDPDYLYSSIIQDIYSLGTVLGKKYKLIRLAYNIFMFGIIISVIAFGIASFLNNGSASEAITNSSGSPF